MSIAELIEAMTLLEPHCAEVYLDHGCYEIGNPASIVVAVKRDVDQKSADRLRELGWYNDAKTWATSLY